MAKTFILAFVAVATLAVLASGAPTQTTPVAPAKPAATTKPAPAKALQCMPIDMTKRSAKLCVAQYLKGDDGKAAVVVPTTVASLFRAADAACTRLDNGKYAFVDPMGINWGGESTRCFNGNKYVTGPTWASLKCCPSGTTGVSSLAKLRETQAEMGVKPGSDTLARYRDTQAESGAKPGSQDLARVRETQAEMGVKPGSQDLARVRETAAENGGSVSSPGV